MTRCDLYILTYHLKVLEEGTKKNHDKWEGKDKELLIVINRVGGLYLVYTPQMRKYTYACSVVVTMVVSVSCYYC